MLIKTLGVDLGKFSCHVVGQDQQGKVVEKRKIPIGKFAEYLANLPPCAVFFEACGGAHHWCRKARSLGHRSEMIPANFVKPFIKSNKNDFNDAEAICEAAQRPTMRFAHLRSAEQQAFGCLLKLREQLVEERTAVSNQAHAFLLEFGIQQKKSRGFISAVADITEDAEINLPHALRFALFRLVERYKTVDKEINELERKIAAINSQNDNCRRLQSIPGVGLITSSFIEAWAGSCTQFKSARDFAAWAGLVPKQHSTGGKSNLLGISKRGNQTLRKYLIHGARSVIQWKLEENHAWSPWIKKLLCSKKKTVAVVAMANKLARIIWAVLTKEQNYAAQVA
jgi:transposase